MALTNREIANIFEDISDMLQIKGEIIHRIMAYRNVAESIRELPRDLRTIAAEGQLETIPFVGKVMAEKIEELLTTGKLEFYERLAAEIPPGVLDILRITGVGPKRAKQFWQEANITTVDELEAAAREGRLSALPGMGKKSEAKILEGIESLRRRAANVRTPLGIALPAAESILERLLALPSVGKGSVGGSLRRGRPTIGDVDLLVTSTDVPAVMNAFVSMDEVARVLGHGTTKSSVELHNGVQVDLVVIAPERWGTALAYFTGSQAHNIHVRELARQKGLTLNEHAFTSLTDGTETLCDSEEAVYAALGMQWIPPEIREDWGEIELALENKIPDLITLDDIRADLHMHTVWSDGKATIREMAEAARARGREYIVITDHSRGATIANGLTIERVLAQQEEVRAVDAEMSPTGFRVFHGTEMEIRADGTLDFPDEVLAQLDFVIASLHVGLRQSREQVTERLLNAIRNPHVDLIGHPRGQLIPDRDPADLDMDAVFAAAKEHGTALEINTNPHRLDLEAQYARRAVELGIMLAIDTDAHRVEELDLMRFGIITARRGWVQAKNVLNTMPVEQFLGWVKQRG
ncbi:MAG TPA: DNA polymerase/3'-5' exonuclease PolX [Oceanobacillus sp.]|nr:DNA polymerase/3'-5' exonuclease PolX [Oceanobacillus sp.]